MTRDELGACVQDALATASSDTVQIVARLRTHTSGANLEQLFIAAIDVARDLLRRIAELECALEESEEQQDSPEGDIEELRNRINGAIDSVQQASHGGDAMNLPIHITADHPICAEANISRQPHEDYLIEQLNRQLLLSTLDGTEGHGLLEKFAAAVLAAGGDYLRIQSTLVDAKRRLRALPADTVPREAVNNAICALWENAMSGILGIDTGLSGALALYRDQQWLLLDMPIVGNAKHHEINGPELCRWLREHQPDHAYIEYAAARPGQGVTSMFHFGCAYGALKMALAACGLPYTVVTPAKWKAAVGVLKGTDKEASRQRALQLFPDQTANLQRKKDHARAEAMLLAFYGLYHFRGATVFRGDDRTTMLLSSVKPHRNAINLRK